MLLQEYNPSWEENFNDIKEIFLAKLEGLEVRIEHVGSTSIKNLRAKPIIDIDVVFCKSTTFAQVNKGLEELGYNHIGNLEIEGREVFKRDNRDEDHRVLDHIKHHVYVCPSDSKELQRHVTFRDYLREHEAARKEYEKLKLDIAKKANQVHQEYAIQKETRARKFVESILDKAKTTCKK